MMHKSTEQHHSSCNTPSYHLFRAFHHKSTLWLPQLAVTDVPTNTMNICYLTAASATSKYCSHKYHEHLLSPSLPSITKETLGKSKGRNTNISESDGHSLIYSTLVAVLGSSVLLCTTATCHDQCIPLLVLCTVLFHCNC